MTFGLITYGIANLLKKNLFSKTAVKKSPQSKGF